MPGSADQALELAAGATPPQTKRRRRWLTFSLRSLMILVTLSCVAVGGKLQYDWYQKKWLVQKWVEPLAKAAQDGWDASSASSTPPPAPPGIKAENEIDLLAFGILELDTPEERFSALKILVESRRGESVPIVRKLIPRSRHREMQGMLLHLVSLARDPGDIPLLERFLTSPYAEVRAAAAESLGYIHEPSFPFAHGFQMMGSRVILNTNPPVDASLVADATASPPFWPAYPAASDPLAIAAERQKRIPIGLRVQLEEVMLHGESEEERTAAARALVAWPPGEYKLRLAEWGVWIHGEKRLEIAKSVLREIPPFAHDVGNPTKSLTPNRFYGPIIITKPVVHLTADRPLAVDLEIGIVGGRPWYAFPRPDDVTVHIDSWSRDATEIKKEDLRLIDPVGLGTLEPLSEGYPWIHPSVRSVGASMARYGGEQSLTEIGLRWQSLIVCPNREPWSSLPVVPKDGSRYEWWESLREVPSSWVTSQGETERFLYYDGPTTANSPLSVQLSDGVLQLQSQDLFWSRRSPQERATLLEQKAKSTQQRDCLFIENQPYRVRALRFRVPTELGHQERLQLGEKSWLTDHEVEKALLAILVEHGLTKEEATGFLVSWREKFFRRPGQRLLTFLTPAEYNRMCPLRIRPVATEVVRVGVVLTEL